ncbi:regulation of protein K48-linked deubiquitination, partial [Bonamia ostreae]
KIKPQKMIFVLFVILALNNVISQPDSTCPMPIDGSLQITSINPTSISVNKTCGPLGFPKINGGANLVNPFQMDCLTTDLEYVLHSDRVTTFEDIICGIGNTFFYILITCIIWAIFVLSLIAFITIRHKQKTRATFNNATSTKLAVENENLITQSESESEEDGYEEEGYEEELLVESEPDNKSKSESESEEDLKKQEQHLESEPVNKSGSESEEEDKKDDKEEDNKEEDNKEEEIPTLEKVLKSVVTIPKDGNCLFRACSLLLFGTQERHPEIRKNAIIYMKDHEHYYKQFMSRNFDEYIKSRSQIGEWGDNYIISAISYYYKKSIHVYLKKQNTKTIVNPEFKKHISIMYSNGNHYDAIVF